MNISLVFGKLNTLTITNVYIHISARTQHMEVKIGEYLSGNFIFLRFEKVFVLIGNLFVEKCFSPRKA